MLQLVNANKTIKGELSNLGKKHMYHYVNGCLSLETTNVKDLMPIIDIGHVSLINSNVCISLNDENDIITTYPVDFSDTAIRVSSVYHSTTDSSEERIRHLEQEVSRLSNTLYNLTTGRIDSHD